MRLLLTELSRLLGTSSDTYRIIRRRLFKVLGLIFAASLIAVALNFWGLKIANAMIGCILPFIALYLFTSPKVIGSVFLSGIITSPRHPIAGAQGVAELIGRALAWIILVTGLFFLAVGTLPFGRSFSAIWVIYLCAGILMMMDIQGVRKIRFVMGLLYTYAIIALVLSLGSMIPGSVHIKAYGHDFFNWSRISPIEDANTRIENAEIEANEKKIVAFLAVIEKKIKKGQELSTNELTLKAYAKALQDGNTAPAKAKEAWRNVFPAKTNTAIVPATVSTFTINQDEVISTLAVPDRSTVYMETDKAFCILEKYGINDDGSEKLSKLTIHQGKSSKYFTWGGTVRIVGLHTNTTVNMHL